jgi:hypothetical protein
MEYQSQFRQDEFVDRLLNVDGGTFLDIGAGDPVRFSNSVYLERVRSWRGICSDPGFVEEHRAQRSSIAYGDAFRVPWAEEVEAAGLVRDGAVDFLSLDLEPPDLTLAMLILLPLDRVRFRVACVEHDQWRPGGDYRMARMRGVMVTHGYQYVCTITDHNKLGIEDWWVDPAYVDRDFAVAVAEQIWQ